MISLVQLLKEVQSQPKAILMAGPAGAGKSYTLNQLGLKNFTTKKRGSLPEKPLLKLKKTFLKNNLLLIYCGNNTSSITCIIPLDALMEAKIWALPFITGFPSTIVILILPPFTWP